LSLHETWRTKLYWQRVGGLLIEEFIAVSPNSSQGIRVIDGLIVLGEENRIHEGNFYDISGRDVIIVQTKSRRLGMYLLGQAYFSKFLIEKYNPRSIKLVAICGKNDSVLGQLAQLHGVEVVVIAEIERKEGI